MLLLALLCKSRLLALLLTLVSIVVLFWFNTRLPLDIAIPLLTLTGDVLFPSDLTPTLLTPMIVFNRVALLLMSAGFLYWSACQNARVSRSRSLDLTVGSVSFCLGLSVIGTMLAIQLFDRSQIDQWIKEHDNHFKPSAFPSVQAVRGQIDIYPGRSLSLELTMDVSISPTIASEFVLFSFNPGYQITELVVGGEEVNDHSFRHGLLKIPRMYFLSDPTTELMVHAHGRPDERFAYLDSVDTVSQIVGPKVRQLRHLGTKNSIFRPEFVVLTPGIKWYPTSGTATNEETLSARAPDYFTLDLEVSVPRNWTVAGPARRELVDDSPRTTFRLRQTKPLPEIALVGAKFESASIQVGEIYFELLFSKAHASTFKPLTGAEEAIREQLQRILTPVQETGLNYPYGIFTIVEVPSTLRVFGGGITMNSVMGPFGMVMIRESALPTIQMESLGKEFPQELIEQLDITDLDLFRRHIGALSRYLQHPMFESNVVDHYYRNLISHQTHAVGDDAHAINLIVEQLAATLLNSNDSNFDFQLAIEPSLINLVSVDPLAILRASWEWEFSDYAMELHRETLASIHTPDLWSLVETLSLREVELREYDYLTLRAMKLRAQRLSQYLVDLNPETLYSVLVELVNRFRWKNFNFEDFVAIFKDHGIDIKDSAGDLMETGGLPGFVVLNPSSRRLDSDDSPKYETTFLLRNGESVSGPVQPSTSHFNTHFDSFFPPMLVEANQTLKVVIESSAPVEHIWIKPYLSLNRMKLRVDLPLSQSKTAERVGITEATVKSIDAVPYNEVSGSAITIDDLDPGFSIVKQRQTSAINTVFTEFVRDLIGGLEVRLDHGLPEFQLDLMWDKMGWLRKTDPTAYGRYRRTFAVAISEDGQSSAKFSTQIPSTGEWTLEYYLPEGYFTETIEYQGSSSTESFLDVPTGTIHFDIKCGQSTTTETLDASDLLPGWKEIGSFNLTETQANVLISDKSDKMVVFADAIRWTPTDSSD